MRTLFLLASTLLFLTVEAQRPNIVVFIVDDMGWEDTSLPFWSERVPNNDIYHTPNMERLASRIWSDWLREGCSLRKVMRRQFVRPAE